MGQALGLGPSMYDVCGVLSENIWGFPINNVTVTLEVNNTAWNSVSTYVAGLFDFYEDFPPVPYQNTTYVITVSFAGTNSMNASAISSTPDGTTYTVSTTNQFGLEPSSNFTVLSVGPQSVLGSMLNETPAQMQESGTATGVLKVRNEFTLGFPWYRFHIMYFFQSVEQFDVGIGLIGGNTFTPENDFANTYKGYVQNVVVDLFEDWCAAEAVQYIRSFDRSAGVVGGCNHISRCR
ncbi:MAG: hypothetical protein ABSB89_09360 [Candidatus Bathyarchaeia archaeon]